MYTFNKRTINCKLVEYKTQNIKTLDFDCRFVSIRLLQISMSNKPCM